MEKYAFTHNRIRKLAKLLRRQKLLKQAGYVPYVLGGGLGAVAGGGLGALLGGKKHRGLGAGIGTGAGAGLGLLGAYLSQNAFGNTDSGVAVPPPATLAPVPPNPPTSKPDTDNPPASKPAPDNSSNSLIASVERNASTPTTDADLNKLDTSSSNQSSTNDSESSGEVPESKPLRVFPKEVHDPTMDELMWAEYYPTWENMTSLQKHNVAYHHRAPWLNTQFGLPDYSAYRAYELDTETAPVDLEKDLKAIESKVKQEYGPDVDLHTIPEYVTAENMLEEAKRIHDAFNSSGLEYESSYDHSRKPSFAEADNELPSNMLRFYRIHYPEYVEMMQREYDPYAWMETIPDDAPSLAKKFRRLVDLEDIGYNDRVNEFNSYRAAEPAREAYRSNVEALPHIESWNDLDADARFELSQAMGLPDMYSEDAWRADKRNEIIDLLRSFGFDEEVAADNADIRLRGFEHPRPFVDERFGIR